MNSATGSAKVALAISSFRSSVEVQHLLQRLSEHDELQKFGEVLVLDSQGDGSLEAAIQDAGWPVKYRNIADANIGSAGNLAERLRWAAQGDCDWVFALNHDGETSADLVSQLVATAQSVPGPVGAVFPARRFPNRDNAVGGAASSDRVDLFWWRKKTQSTDVVETSWSSSNGALYSLSAIRAGLLPFDEFWMGWEDLAYGWLLHDAGYKQYTTHEITLDDNYEYRRVGPPRLELFIADKAAWYEYYYSRNLLLTAQRLGRPIRSVLPRLVSEALLIGLLRDRKRARFLNYLGGLVDFKRGVTGQKQNLR